MAWCHQATSHNLSQCWPRSLLPYDVTRPQWVNKYRLRQIGCHFADNTLKRIFLNENVRIFIKISLKFVSKGSINNIPALAQIMVWCQPGNKPLSEPKMVRLLTYICITRSQWFNPLRPGDAYIYTCPDTLSSLAQCNGLLPVRHQAITWNQCWLIILNNCTLWKQFSEIQTKIYFSCKKIHLKMSAAKWPFCSFC